MPQNTHKKSELSVQEIEKIAYELRQDVITMLLEAGSGHTAGALGTAEIFSALYFNILDINPKNFNEKDRDVFVLSGGHICPIWYATLSKAGFFPKKELWKLRKTGELLQGHPNFEDKQNGDSGIPNIPGVENASGSLGQGLSIAIGKAISMKLDNINNRVYCITGDGELNEGQIWEAAMFAPNYGINNLTWIIDNNGIQLDGPNKEIMNLLDLRAKLESFGWYTIEIDGHNVEEIINSCSMAKAVSQRPTAIIAHTIPGKGVDFMEYKFEWHGKVPSEKEAQKAIKELKSLGGKIKND